MSHRGFAVLSCVSLFLFAGCSGEKRGPKLSKTETKEMTYGTVDGICQSCVTSKPKWNITLNTKGARFISAVRIMSNSLILPQRNMPRSRSSSLRGLPLVCFRPVI